MQGYHHANTFAQSKPARRRDTQAFRAGKAVRVTKWFEDIGKILMERPRLTKAGLKAFFTRAPGEGKQKGKEVFALWREPLTDDPAAIVSEIVGEVMESW